MNSVSRLLLLLAFALCVACGGGGGSDTGGQGDVAGEDTGMDARLPDAAADTVSPDLGPDVTQETWPEDLWPVCKKDEHCNDQVTLKGPCQKAVCDQEAQTCGVKDLEDGTECDDGDECTGGDVCKAGTCAGTDELCAAECGDGECADSEDCAGCEADCGVCPPACCQAQPTALCGDTGVEQCVCGQDPYCCLKQWDDFCTGLANAAGCVACPGLCGNQWCEPSESCTSCQEDCGECPPCGNFVCEPGESCETCKTDCGKCAVCGDGVCHPGKEDCLGCEADCGACTADCCTVHPTPGCATPEVQECVCAMIPVCCSYAWFAECVFEVNFSMCGSCSPSCGNGICDAEESCESCKQDCGECIVCGDGYCQPPEWCNCEADCGACGVCGDGACTLGEDCQTCKEDCGPCDGCGDGACGKEEDCLNCVADCGVCTLSCCSVHDSVGCDDETVEACVCGKDGFCCEDHWDKLCTFEVNEFECGYCEPSCGDGKCEGAENCLTCAADCMPCAEFCCVVSDASPGCPDSEVGACVCEKMPECCTVAWTAECVAAVNDLECGTCQEVCGNGKCGHYESCANCPQDCGECDFCPDLYLAPNPCCQNGDPCNRGKDGVCECGGSCAWESADCGVKDCGDGTCAALENCWDCPDDCGLCYVCGDQICDDYNGESCKNCEQDCGTCYVCGDSFCDEVYGETCDVCPDDCGECAVCGDGYCQTKGGEYCDTCPADCGECPVCGNGVCEAEKNETCGGCPQDCGECPCVPDCNGKNCGGDGCGGSCGECAEGQYCTLQGVCMTGTPADCSNPIYVPSVPYQHQGDTTPLADAHVAAGCGASGQGMGAPDVAYVFTPTVSTTYRITLSPVSGDRPCIVMIYTQCPVNSSVCYHYSEDLYVDEAFNVALDAGVTYYLIVDGLYPADVGPYLFGIEIAPI